MAKKRTTKNTTKAIADTAGVTVDAGGERSIVALQSLDRALTPRQCYEMNPTFRRAVTVITTNEAKAKVRLFSRASEDEIVSGDAFKFFQKRVTSRFIADMGTYWKIHGEIAVFAIHDGTKLTDLKLLNPAHLQPYPVNARSLSQVTHWLYNDGYAVGGEAPTLHIPAEHVIYRKNFNPYSEVRGLSEALTLVNEVSTNHYIQRFNVSFFKNGCTTDLLIRFPKGTKPKVMEDYIERWQEMHSIRADNGFRIAGFIGDEIQVETPSNLPKEGSFLDLHGKNEETIAGMMGVPASIMGFYGRTRFDTIDAELECFAENTLLPDLQLYGEVLQDILDRYFPSARGTGKATAKRLARYARKAFERARHEQGQSDIVAICDPDTLPIMGKLQTAKIKVAKEMREALDMSASEVIEYLDLDIPYDPVRDDVWVPSGRTNITKESRTAEAEEQVKELRTALEVMQEAAKPAPAVSKDVIRTIQDYYRTFRSAACDAAEGKVSLNEVKGQLIELARSVPVVAFEVQFHKDFLAVSKIINSDTPDKVRAVKDYLNGVSRPSVLKANYTENE